MKDRQGNLVHKGLPSSYSFDCTIASHVCGYTLLVTFLVGTLIIYLIQFN